VADRPQHAARSLRGQEGQAAVEMALVLPILVALIVGIVEFGIAFNNYLTLTDATRAGARKAAVSRFIGDNGASARAAVVAAAPGLTQSALSVTATSQDANGVSDWTTPGDVVTVTASYPYSINILGVVVKAGNLTSTTKERLE
jgi:Flp pilus assembly protein TadG